MSIVLKIILLVSLSVVIVMAGLEYVSIRQTEKVLHEDMVRDLNSGLDFAARDVLHRIQNVTRTSEIIARDPMISRSLFLEISTGTNQHLNEMVGIYPFFKYVMIVEPSRDVFAISTTDNQGHKTAGEEILGLNFRDNPLFTEPSGKGTTISAPGPDPYLELLEVKGGMNQWFITPVLKGETLLGWVVVAYDWEAEMSKMLDDITRELTAIGYPVTETVLADQKGNIVIGAGPGREKLRSGPNVLLSERPFSFGNMKLRLVIANDTAEVMKPVMKLKSFLLIVGSAATVLLASILYLVLRGTFLARLAAIQGGTQAFREGDLSYRIPSLGHDELGELAKTFNEMGRSLQTALAELKVEKEQLALTLENAPVGIVTCDTGGRFLTANPAFCEMLGYSAADVQRLSIRDVTHPDDVAESLTALQDLLDGASQILILEKRYIRKDSSICLGIVRSGLVRDERGRPQLLVGAIEDVTERKKVKEALRESEQRYRRLFEDAPIMYVITRNEQGVPFISDCNEMFLHSVGYEKREVLGKELADFYSAQSRADLLEGGGYARALAGEFFMGERQLLTRDGRLIPTLLYTATEEDAAGQVIGTRAMFVDVTELKRVEQSLRESEERFKSVFQSHHVLMLILDPETGRIVDSSPGACAFYGYTREELTKKNIMDINTLSPEEIFERMQIAKSQQRRYFDFRHRLASGEVRDVEVCTGPIVAGGRTLLFSVIQDVTDRKQAEEALRQSEELNRLLIEASPVGIGILLDDALAYANPTLLKTFGFESPQEIVGQSVYKFIGSRDLERLLQSQQDILAGKEIPPYHEASGVRKNGETFDMTVWPRRIDYQGKPSMLFFLADTSESKALRSQLAQAQKMEAVGTLAGGIAHDFNNILQVALGYSELILGDDGLPQQFRGDLRRINESARRGADLVQRLLTFSRKVESKPQPLNLNRRINEMRKMLERTIPKMIEIQLLLAEKVATINADPTQIDQALMNLAVNARDAMPEGGKLAIETANVVLDEEYARMRLNAKPGPYVLLTVTDTGTGMDQETLAHIFEPFYTTKSVGEGTGLGLAMVHGIVQQHGGHVRCLSEPGKGTTFKVYFPAIPDEVTTQAEFDNIAPAFGTETILLVDDETFVRELGARILTKHGYTVLQTTNGREGLDLFRKKRSRISLVILDLIMPEMSGMECLKELLNLDPQVNVLIASGFSAETSVNETIEMGAKGFVGKPFRVAELLQNVRRVLDHD